MYGIGIMKGKGAGKWFYRTCDTIGLEYIDGNSGVDRICGWGYSTYTG
jgi:hypothetical protein